MQKKVVVIHDQKKKKIHFTQTALRGNDLWFPYNCTSESLLIAVGKIMVGRNIALSVTTVERLRRCGVCEDFEVTYNAI